VHGIFLAELIGLSRADGFFCRYGVRKGKPVQVAAVLMGQWQKNSCKLCDN